MNTAYINNIVCTSWPRGETNVPKMVTVFATKKEVRPAATAVEASIQPATQRKFRQQRGEKNEEEEEENNNLRFGIPGAGIAFVFSSLGSLIGSFFSSCK